MRRKKYNGEFSHRRKFPVLIGSNKCGTKFETDLLELPQFIRFGEVKLDYCWVKVMEEKCRLVVNYLQPLKKALNGSNLIHFIGFIEKNNPYAFSNHSQLINHLQKELLPVCGSSRGYKFDISSYFHSDEKAREARERTLIIASILEMDPIGRCSTIEIDLEGLNQPLQSQLPVGAITNWLHRRCAEIREKSEERFLRIYSDNYIQNGREMCDYLKQVLNF